MTLRQKLDQHLAKRRRAWHKLEREAQKSGLTYGVRLRDVFDELNGVAELLKRRRAK